MHDTARAWIERYFDTLNTQPKTPEILKRFIRDDHLLAHIQVFEEAFPGYTMTPQDIVSDGDRVAVRFVLHGTHLGRFQGMPPTGRTVRVPGIIIYRLQDDAITEHWLQADVPGMLAQLNGTTPVQVPA